MAHKISKSDFVSDSAELAGGTLTIATVSHGSILALTVWGSIDLLTVPQLAEAVDEAVAGRPEGLIIDLTYTDFLSSVGMAALVNAHDAVLPSGGRFGVVAEGSSTARPIKLVGLDQTISLYATIEDALQALTEELAPATRRASA
ncbi:anti-anti-sigma factor [Williamsia muralis]|uniref:Anti-sigma factor antagonist n=1 Tax=Williamsia marianensis TaxID=85044 RepID=A0A2G3PMM8_WILMA|nr:STAS domain-containing protein [Williamsia marianensis]PHV67041.1 anti-anti-sigma factor [Williamsia marianensis]PZT98825.1 MAG: anti-sigma factor antagonist [Gordonia sp. (in: high G+C Gram-positive bacteria)]